MSPGDLFWLSVAAAVLTCLAAIGARALREFSRHDLQEICERNNQLDRFAAILREHDRVALAIEMLVVLGSSVFAAAGSFWAWRRWGEWLPLVDGFPPWQTVAGIALLLGLVLGAIKTWLPWSVSRLFAASFLYGTWPVWRLLASILSPLVLGARFIDTVLHRILGREATSPDEDSIEEEIRTIVTEGHREGLLEENAREMIEGVMELGDADVAHIMTPRTDMHMLSVATPWDEMLQDIISLGHTRIPVFDKTRDDIIGVLYVKDLLHEIAKDSYGQADVPHRLLNQLVRKPVFVPETKAVDDLLKMFRQTRTHIAIALDEYGGVAGLVTIEDVLEEIVGEIVDEYDAEVEEEINRVNDDVIEALGRAHVDEINEAMNLELPEDGDYDTIGGFVFSELGRVPTAGDTLEWQECVRVTVLEATKRRIERVRLERLDPTASRESA